MQNRRFPENRDPGCARRACLALVRWPAMRAVRLLLQFCHDRETGTESGGATKGLKKRTMQAMRSKGVPTLGAVGCSAGWHADAELEADASAATRSRRNSGFSLFSSASFCRLLRIAEETMSARRLRGLR